MSGPVARALKGSYLESGICPGIQALPAGNRKHVSEALRPEFRDSLDLDAATRPRYPTDARWDYLLGHRSTEQVIAIETHSAHTSEVSLVIEKRAAARRHLSDQLRPGETIAAWYWVASGPANFSPFDKIVNRLNQHGIQFVGGRLESKHLASLQKRTTISTRNRGRSRK